ncbi:MAG TPA: O-antigen ligase family protein [Flavobacterium sp.]|jgi:hypothetical protein
MSSKDKKYLFFVVLHILLGVVIFTFPVVSKVLGFILLPLGLCYVIVNRNRNNEALLVCGYVVGSEVFFRMTGGNFIYEFGKYGVIVFVFAGMFFDGLSKNAVAYWFYLLLLVPGLLIATQVLDYDSEIRKTISFNISGPLCLGITALYTYGKRVTLSQINEIMLYIGMPVISCTMYLILYSPSVQDVVTGTNSNFETSGGFGPNQVATVLGLGMFIFISRILFETKSFVILAVNTILVVFMAYRGLVTFSRGGMLTGLFMLVILFCIIYFRVNKKAKMRLNYILVAFTALLVGIWIFSTIETSGLIQKRYGNQDASGKVKESQLSGRERISQTEINYFLENPVFGIGVAKGAQLRREETGAMVLSHNEITRMLAEHGTLGIIALLILFFTPMVLYLENKSHIYLLCFLVFWLLTINHAAMRLAAPAYIYALSLLKVQANEVSPVRRK